MIDVVICGALLDEDIFNLALFIAGWQEGTDCVYQLSRMECIRVKNVALPRIAHLCFLRGDTCRTLHDTIYLVSCLDPLTDPVLICLDRDPILSTNCLFVNGYKFLLIQKVLDLAELGRTVITLLSLFRLLLLLVVVFKILVLLHILIFKLLILILQLLLRGRPRSHQNIARV